MKRKILWLFSLSLVFASMTTLSSKTYMTSLPGALDGEYVVIQFETSFQNKKIGR